MQQSWFEDGRKTMRSWLRSWPEARQQAVSGQQMVPAPQTGSVHGDEPPVPEGSALLQYCSPCAVPSRTFALLLCRSEWCFCWYCWEGLRPTRTATHSVVISDESQRSAFSFFYHRGWFVSFDGMGWGAVFGKGGVLGLMRYDVR